MRIEILGNDPSHYLVCRCGYDPFEALSTDNSGPDEDSATVALARHLQEAH